MLELQVWPHLDVRYNIAPSQYVACVRTNPDSKERECVEMKWGLIPSWAKEPRIGHQLINARVETVADKPAFRKAFRNRRCLILADGFYEWRREKKTKQPYFVRFVDNRPFAFAGVWELHPSPHWFFLIGVGGDSSDFIDVGCILFLDVFTHVFICF